MKHIVVRIVAVVAVALGFVMVGCLDGRADPPQEDVTVDEDVGESSQEGVAQSGLYSIGYDLDDCYRNNKTDTEALWECFGKVIASRGTTAWGSFGDIRGGGKPACRLAGGDPDQCMTDDEVTYMGTVGVDKYETCHSAPCLNGCMKCCSAVPGSGLIACQTACPSVGYTGCSLMSGGGQIDD